MAGVHAVVLGARGKEHARAALPRGAWHMDMAMDMDMDMDMDMVDMGLQAGCTGLQAECTLFFGWGHAHNAGLGAQGCRLGAACLTERTRARAVRAAAGRAHLAGDAS